MPIPETKIDRFIQNDIQTLFFRRGDIIYREGDINSFLFIITSGEANLFQNFEKCEYSFMKNNQFSLELIKNMAKRIDYKDVMKNAFEKHPHLNYNMIQHNEKIDDTYEDFNNLFDEKNNKSRNSVRNNTNNLNFISKTKEEVPEKSTIDTLNLELLLEKDNLKNILTLSKGSIGGLEICTGITKFKYSLISNSEFTSCFKIDLRKLDGEHLTDLMVNLLPLFIEYERKKNNKESYFFKEEENDDKYKKRIQKIDRMFDTNEGGFIKMNNYNMNLQKKKNELKD